MSDFLHLIVTGRTPPGQFRYTFPEDGYQAKNFSYEGWQMGIKNHYKWNDIPMPENWLAIAEDQLCKLLPPGQCEYGDGTLPEHFLSLSFGLHDAMNGTKALASWTASGFPLVERAVAEARGKTCAACYANVRLPGCGTCVGFANLVADIVGTEPLGSDPQLEGKSCAYCRCASRANVWVPVSVSRNSVSMEVMVQAPDWCWKRKEMESAQ